MASDGLGCADHRKSQVDALTLGCIPALHASAHHGARPSSPQVDALTLGCIPVIFTPHAYQYLWPLHWGPFRDTSSVLLDMRKVRVRRSASECVGVRLIAADCGRLRPIAADCG